MPDISYLTIQISILLKHLGYTTDKLMEIVQDRIITEDEKPELKNIVCELDEFSQKIQSLKLWAQKNLK
ncbi:hypothetical protein ACSVC9_11965 [Clostridium sp. LBM24168]